MSGYLAQRITQKLIASGAIAESESELYTYGFFLLVSHVYLLLVTVISGILLGIPGASVLFYVLFALLRGYAGGVHAKTENACTVLTTLSVVACLISIKLMGQIHGQVVPACMLGIGGAAVFLLSPLDTVAKPLEESERRRYRRISLGILLGYLLLAFAAWIVTWTNVIYVIACTIFLEGILLVSGKIFSVAETPVKREDT